MKPTREQVAAVLERAALCRADVRKARIEAPGADKPSLSRVRIWFYTPGRRVEREANLLALVPALTPAQVLDPWIGPEPRDRYAPRRQDRARADARRRLDTPIDEQVRRADPAPAPDAQAQRFHRAPPAEPAPAPRGRGPRVPDPKPPDPRKEQP